MKIPMKFRYYDNWVKVPLIISGLFTGSGIVSWVYNSIYLQSEISAYEDKLNEYLAIGMISLCFFVVFKYLNYRVELKNITGLWPIEEIDQDIYNRLEIVFKILNDPEFEKELSSQIQSTFNRLKRLVLIQQVESSINEEIRKVEVMNTARKLVNTLNAENKDHLLSDLNKCKYAYQMEELVNKYKKVEGK